MSETKSQPSAPGTGADVGVGGASPSGESSPALLGVEEELEYLFNNCPIEIREEDGEYYFVTYGKRNRDYFKPKRTPFKPPITLVEKATFWVGNPYGTAQHILLLVSTADNYFTIHCYDWYPFVSRGYCWEEWWATVTPSKELFYQLKEELQKKEEEWRKRVEEDWEEEEVEEDEDE